MVDTSGHFCPRDACSYHGWVGFGNLRANGHLNGRRWRQLYCLGCKGHFLETHGMPFHVKQVEIDKLVWAIAALAEGLGIRAVARVFEVDPNTVLGGWSRRPSTWKRSPAMSCTRSMLRRCRWMNCLPGSVR
jgi:hypothetical protein